jgi:hypothetical protein
MRRAKRIHQTFQPHRDWQTHEFRVSFLFEGQSPLNMSSGYMFRLYREGFELAPRGSVWPPEYLILYVLDSATGPSGRLSIPRS